MTPRRAALVERFRQTARQRIEAVRAGLRSGSVPSLEMWTEWLGNLHTTKGEARMLGMPALTEATHVIEERLQTKPETWSSVDRDGLASALAVLAGMLDPSLTAADLDARRARVVDALASRESLATAALEPRVEEPAPPAKQSESLVQVQAAHLDRVCDGLDELRAEVARLAAAGGGAASDAIDELMGRIERLSAAASELRLGPVEPLLSSLARHALELGAHQGKRLTVAVDAAGTELERAVLDTLADPLLHLVRNAVDHGVRFDRPGKIAFRTSARAASVTVVVEDDGPGIDLQRLREAAISCGILEEQAAIALSDEEALDLVFRPHVSTRLEASEISGRGLGLDVVRRVVESIGGRVSVESLPERGTRFLLDVPVRLTREPTLVVEAGSVLVGVPSRHVAKVVETAKGMEAVAGGHAIRVDGELVPLRDLNTALGLASPEETPIALVIDVADRRWAIAISGLVGEHEIPRRPADRALAAFSLAGASAVLDDGRPLLLPAIADLIRRAGAQGVRVPRAAATAARKALRALVVDDSPIAREVVTELVASTGMEVLQAGDGQAGLDLLDGRSVDLIVTDVEMPRVDGFELTRRIRARGVRTPIVVVTTRGSVEDRRRAAECGADAYVVKTEFRDSDLLEAVRGLVAGAR